ncbi:MAG: tRNA uridine-5-carboxymethylaminomethyl(34) synthesis GTPase MnmE [Candidatus Stahlbacteria bacterium]|nr:MAG: tRNA uridine-5-carboxymethylaminomethyl(34) synthesis GTPase MnmE [Candidatus Stahlbacteria bacterium]
MSLNDTIVACATPAGYSSIGVIRISGDQTLSLVKKIFVSRQKIQDFETNHAYYGNIIDPDNNDVIDKIIATFYLTPHSYTGEDVVELSCHGNPLIIDRITKILTGMGARIAQRGEFTKRALLNGKIDLLQAEAVLDTVIAPCNEARKLAITQYEGKLSDKIYELRSKIVDLLSFVEANIDFPEEEDIQNSDIGIEGGLKSIIEEIDELLKGAEIGVKIKEGYKVLITGRTNVGKSTLFNKLVGYDRAIIHEEPGTTRDYIEDRIEVSGLYLCLFDTAGIFNTAAGPDKIAQDRTISLVEQSDLILLMFDGSEPMNEEDLYLYNLTKDKDKILIVNKIDLNIRLNESEILCDSIKISAKTGKNIDLLIQNIKSKLLPKFDHKQILLTRQRHIDALKNAKEYFIRAQKAYSPETIAFELHAALDVIGELTGKVMRKEILDRIFEEFCIGK